MVSPVAPSAPACTFPQSFGLQTSVPVVIVGGSLNALGVARSLAPLQTPIYVLDTSKKCPAAWSRYVHFIRIQSLDGTRLVTALLELAAKLGEPSVLILTDDRAVEVVSEHRDELRPHFLFQLPSRAWVKTLADKVAFQSFAEAARLPVPRSMTLGCASEILSLRQLELPVVLKPALKQMVLNGASDRAVRCDRAEELLDCAGRMLNAVGSVIAQEWIEGQDTDIYFTLFVCDRPGRIRSSFTGRKLVCEPPRLGSTAVCAEASEDVVEALDSITRCFVSLTEYQGLGSLEFKRDQTTGRFVIVEPTVGRTDWQEEIASLNGVNLPLNAYESALGLSSFSEKSRRSQSNRYLWAATFFYPVPKPFDTIALKRRDGYFRWLDPAPALYFYLYEWFMKRVLNRLKRSKKVAKPMPESPLEPVSVGEDTSWSIQKI